MTAADVLVESLIDWGVEVIFGLPGDGINGIMEALRTHRTRFASFTCAMKRPRHSWPAPMQSTLANSACVWPRPAREEFTLNGLYDAKMDGQPVLAITGLQFHDLIGTHTQQDVALDKLFMDVCCLQRARHGADSRGECGRPRVPHRAFLSQALRTSPIPVDFQEMEVEEAPALEAQHPSSYIATAGRWRRCQQIRQDLNGSGHSECGKEGCDPGRARRA